MKKKIVIFSLMLLLGIVSFIGVVVETGIDSIWAQLRQFSLLHFFIFIGLSTLNFMLYNFRWFLILNKLFDGPVKFWKLFFHRMSGFAVSYLTPSAQTGGEPLRVMLLTEDGVPSNIAISSIIIDKAMELAALFIFISLGLFVAILDGSIIADFKFAAAGVLVLLFLTIFWFYFATFNNIGFFSSFLRFTRLNKFKKIIVLENKLLEIEKEMFNFYKKNVRTFLVLILISIVIASFLLLEHYLVARFMGVRLSFTQTFLVSTIPYLAFIIPVPGGLGLLEGGTAAVFAGLGISINAFVLVFIIRIRDLFFVIIGLLHASKQAFLMIKKGFRKNGS